MKTITFKTITKKFPLLKKRLEAIHAKLCSSISKNEYPFDEYVEELVFYRDKQSYFIENYDEELAFKWDSTYNRLRPISWDPWDTKVTKSLGNV